MDAPSYPEQAWPPKRLGVGTCYIVDMDPFGRVRSHLLALSGTPKVLGL